MAFATTARVGLQFVPPAVGVTCTCPEAVLLPVALIAVTAQL